MDGAGKKPSLESERGIKTIVCRVGLGDFAALNRRLADDGLSVQHFLASMVAAYISGDRSIEKLIEPIRREARQPREVRAHALSTQEKRDLYDLIEHMEDE